MEKNALIVSEFMTVIAKPLGLAISKANIYWNLLESEGGTQTWHNLVARLHNPQEGSIPLPDDALIDGFSW